MNVVGKVGSFITQGMYSVATPFHPFGGAVDIIVVKQEDGTFRSTPWYVRFGKFQGVLKGAEKLVRIEVNGVEANFHMHLDNSGEANFVREVDPDKDDGHGLAKSGDLEARREDNNTDYSKDVKENDFYGQDSNEFNNSAVDVRDERFTLGMDRLERVESDCDRIFYEFQDEQSSLEGSIEFSDYGSRRFDNLESVERALESQNSSSEVVLVSVDGHILTAPLLSSERNAANVELTTPQFHLGPGEGTEEYNRGETSWSADYLDNLDASSYEVTGENDGKSNNATLSSEHQLNSEGDREHEIYLGNLDRELCIRTKTENAPDSLKREEVFKSCLELRELAVQSTNGNQEIRGSSAENLDSTEDPHEKSPRSPLANDRKEKENLEISTKDDAFPPTWSQVEGAIGQSDFVTDNNGCDGKHAQFVSSDEELQKQTEVDVALEGMHSGENGCDGKHAQFVSSDEELQEQTEVDVSLQGMHSGEEVSASEDESSESENVERPLEASNEDPKSDVLTRVEISLCGNLLHAGMGLNAAEDAFETNRISPEEFKLSATSIAKNENLIVRIQGKYLPWEKAAHVVLGMVAFGLDLPIGPDITIPVEPESSEAKEDDSEMTSTPSRRWRLWPIPFRRVKTLEHSGSNSSSEEVFVDSESVSPSQPITTAPKARTSIESPRKQIVRTNVPTTDQIESLNLKEGQNMVNFVFSTRVLGSQKVDAHIYVWKWNTRIVISDVDGTITKSDVLGQFMPLVGKDWTHSGIARLFSAIKENGYQLLFLSARAIVQAYLTKSFLFNLKQDGKSLPNGPVVISPDGLFPSLYREVIRRAPHEFKIACLEDIKALFPPDYNPFYAGFGNRDTDELSYRKIGIPKGKIFIINPKGEVAINHRIDVKSYTSLHTLVNDMFPPTALVEQEDYNSWNYWKMPLPDIDNL